MAKRAHKLQEFVAHSSNVNCLKIGRRSSGVLVTGGDDKKVNMWAIGKPDSIMSLTGHVSPIECVTFDIEEEKVLAGAASGTLRLWDLKAQRSVCSLKGHRANCVAVDFNPVQPIIASGSLDTNLKIWDPKTKHELKTYKGHTGGVRCLKFSPDGRWLASGGQDNSVKLWDIRGGKLMHDFTYHDGPINDLTFHPHEFVLATGSQDRTTKLWDLETFDLIGSAGPEATGVRNVYFTPDGRTVLSAVQDNLKVWGWEPLVCHDSVDTNWGRTSDMALQEGKVIGCSIHQSIVGVWIVDLSRVAPFSPGGQAKPAPRRGSTPLAESKYASNGSDIGSQMPSRDLSQHSSRATTPADMITRAKAPPETFERPAGTPSNTLGGLSSIPPVKAADFYIAKAPPVAKGSPRRQGSIISTPPENSPRRGSDDSARAVGGTAGSRRESSRTPREEEANLGAETMGNGNSVLPKGEDRGRDESGPASGSGRATEHPIEGAASTHRALDKKGEGETEKGVYSNGDTNPPQRSDAANDTGQSVSKGRLFRRLSRGEKKEVTVEILTPQGPNPHRTADSEAAGVPSGAEPTRAGGKRRSGLFKPEDHDIFGPIQTADGGRDADGAAQTPPGESVGEGRKERAGSPKKEKESRSVVIPAPGDSLVKGAGLPGGAFSTPETSGPGFPSSHPPPASNGGSKPKNDTVDRLTALARSPSVTGDRARRDGPMGLDIKAFLPKSASKLALDGEVPKVSDSELIEALMGQHATMSTIMQSRLTNLAVVRTFWARNDLKGAIEAMEKMADHALLVDVLGTMSHRADVFTLELCAQALPLLGELLTSQHERYVLVAIAVAASLLKSFGLLIKEARQASPAVGVDLSAEERLERCNSCYRGFVLLRDKLQGLARKSGDVGKASRDLIFELEALH